MLSKSSLAFPNRSVWYMTQGVGVHEQGTNLVLSYESMISGANSFFCACPFWHLFSVTNRQGVGILDEPWT